MKVIQGEQTYTLIRFEKGERFLDVFQGWLSSIGIKGAFFYGLGGATMIRAGSYHLETKQYTMKEFSNDHFEVLNLTGNVSVSDNTLKVHCHITFSDHTLASFGGHLEELLVGGTLEVYVQHLEPLTRIQDPQVGLALLISHS